MLLRVKKLNFFDYLSLLTVVIAFVGLFFGRTLQREVELSLLNTAIIFGLLGGSAFYYLRRTSLIEWKIFSRSGSFLAITLYLAAAVSIYHYVSFKIETVHFIQFSLLAIFLVLSWATNQNSIEPSAATKAAAKAALAVIALSCFEEFLQLYVPDRFFDWRDIAINCFSSLFGAVLGYLTLNKSS